LGGIAASRGPPGRPSNAAGQGNPASCGSLIPRFPLSLWMPGAARLRPGDRAFRHCRVGEVGQVQSRQSPSCAGVHPGIEGLIFLCASQPSLLKPQPNGLLSFHPNPQHRPSARSIPRRFWPSVPACISMRCSAHDFLPDLAGSLQAELITCLKNPLTR